MADQAGEKKFEATHHHRQKARKQGQVARSQDLVAVALLFSGVAALLMVGELAAAQLTIYTDRTLSESPRLDAKLTDVTGMLSQMAAMIAWIITPLLALLLLVAAMTHIAQVGWLILPEKLMPDARRINPAQGLKRIFSLHNLVRVFMGLAKMAVVLGVAAVALWQERDRLMSVVDMSVPQIAQYLSSICLWTSLKIAGVLLVLALFDYFFQWWKLEKDLMMTEQQLKDEMKETQGDPNLVQARRAAHRQMVGNRLKKSVVDSDFVVSNPTEFAVAMKYDISKPGAPRVVAKGAGVLAQRIRRLALENNIPIVERKELAQALYAEVEEGHEIPAKHYAAVGEVIRYVYELKGETAESLRKRAAV